MNRLFTTPFKVTVCLGLLVALSDSSFAQDLTGDNLILDGGAADEAQIQLVTGPADGNPIHGIVGEPGFGVYITVQDDSDNYTYPFDAYPGAPTDSLNLMPAGVGLGTATPGAGLHIFSDGTNGLADATIIAQNNNPTVEGRTMAVLANNGDVQINIQNLDSTRLFAFVNQKVSEEVDAFSLASALQAGGGEAFPFVALSDVPDFASTLTSVGNGIGTEAPMEMLHLLADGNNYDRARVVVENDLPTEAIRDMFSLVNKGGSRFSLVNTSTATEWFFQTNNSDEFSIRTNSPTGPTCKLRPDGTFLINILGSGGANLKLDTAGNLKIKGTLTQSSDRNMKENFQVVDPQQVLKKVVSMPITTWNFKTTKEIKHLGPVAQDFFEQFELGEGETTISPIDTIGVSLAAIQGLNQKLEKQRKQIKQLKNSLNAHEEALNAQQETFSAERDELLSRMERLEATVSALAGAAQSDETVSTAANTQN